MDFSQLVPSLLSLLAPILPVLIQAGSDLSDATRKTIADRVGTGLVDGVFKLWSRIRGSNSAKKAVERVAEDPESKKKLGALELEIEDLLKADPTFAAELKQFLAAVGPNVGGNKVTATGTGAVAVGESVGGSVTTNVKQGQGDS